MKECLGKYFIKNGKLLPSGFFDDSLVYEGDSVYEVLRMFNISPVFFHDHIKRLENSVMLQNKVMLAGAEDILHDILKLTQSEGIKDTNLKIIFNYNGSSFNYLVYFIEPIYPTHDQYNNGVKGLLFNAERKDPASKLINHKLRADIYHKLILEGAYEALLVDHNNCITEGSRSNIFFIKNDILFTAPESIVLSGITRKYIIDICHDHGITVVFQCVNADSIGEYDAVFMSGTSPMVLPFSRIDNSPFDVKLPLMAELRKLYTEKAEESIRQFSAE